MNDSAEAKGRGIGALVFFTLMAAPFCLPLATWGIETRDYVHMGLLVAMSALMALLWWAGVRSWGSSGALLAVAALPPLAGIATDTALGPGLDHGYATAMQIAAAVVAVGGLTALVLVRDPIRT